MDINKLNSPPLLWANNLRALSIFAVVLLHVASEFVSNIDGQDILYGSRSWWAGNIYASVSMWCIPLFVMISGYFLLNTSEPHRLFYKKRLQRIGIPLLFWSVFYSIWLLLKHSMNGDISSAYFTVAKGWALGEPYYHLWYLFMIPFLYLITPVLRVIITAITQKEMLVVICLCFALAMLAALSDIVLLYFNLNAKVSLFTNEFLSYIGYFCLGGYIAKYSVSVNIKACLLLFCIAILITITGSYFITHLYFYSYLSINIVLASIALFFIIKHYANKNLKLENIAKVSFGIYLIHPLFIKAFQTVQPWLLNWIDVSVYIPLVASCTLLLSYLTAISISKIRWLARCI
ncbi:hypothetical protein A9264_04855 [Vibrio sp. UCD-FRSSP16_10]|uniref:acyltransferase n=1 Tax=unclassified Vibrio TaxID=2614977 RepID=UPI0007FDB3A1|nr:MULTISPECIES: acyltransferase family protein [unclassified Vibrio]OBT08566.1 hypothetical protein A9260_07095 [Vibrio sp. UCD-FRSSP16_30]OBT18096.1 hypothetical protein A9264_04855 [Vibrio sp. UCD-FRSSP16_10]